MGRAENVMNMDRLGRMNGNGVRRGDMNRGNRSVRMLMMMMCVMCIAALSFGSGAEPAFAATLKVPTVVLEKYGSTEISVNVKKMAGADGYVIYRAKTKTGTFKKVTSLTAKKAKKPYIDSGLKASTKYFYKVRAYAKVKGKKKYGKYSAVKTVKTKATPNGNAAKYNVNKIKQVLDSDLNGQTAYFLGSSVTKGKGSENDGNGDVSFVDMLEWKYGMIVTKSAENGTTLVDKDDSRDSGKSYIDRLKKMPKAAPDYFVCQLSTNDATKGSPIGSVVKGEFNIKKFNTGTVDGAIEYVTAYAQQTWNCPVIFYIPTKPKDKWTGQSTYLEMIGELKTIQGKWNAQYEDQLQIIDLWNSKAAKFTTTDDRLLCMYDTLHPTKAGYLKKYVPTFEKYLKDLCQKIKEKLTGAEEPAVNASETVESIEEAVPETSGETIEKAMPETSEETIEESMSQME